MTTDDHDDPILEVVREAGLATTKRGNELAVLCPKHGDTKPSLRLNEQKNVWRCDPCGEGGGPAKLRRLLGLPARGPTVVRACEIPEVETWLILGRRLPSHEVASMFAAHVNFGPSFRGAAAAFRYMDSEGRFLYTKYRLINSKDFRRWPKGAPTVLYGLASLRDVTSERVIVVEGELDWHALHGVGIGPTVSLPDGVGTSLTKELLAPLEAFALVLLAVDDDSPGDGVAGKLAAALGPNRCRRVRFRQGVAA